MSEEFESAFDAYDFDDSHDFDRMNLNDENSKSGKSRRGSSRRDIERLLEQQNLRRQLKDLYFDEDDLDDYY